MSSNSTNNSSGQISDVYGYQIYAALLLAVYFIFAVVSCCRDVYQQHYSTPPLPPPATVPLPHIIIEPPPLPLRSNTGLGKNILNSFPKLRYSVESADKYADCAICLSEFRHGDELRILPPCGHGFHVECVDSWLVSHPTCPSCRRSMVPEWCVKISGDDSRIPRFIT